MAACHHQSEDRPTQFWAPGSPVVADRLRRVTRSGLLEGYGEAIDHVQPGQSVDVGTPIPTPLGHRGSTRRVQVFGHHEDHLVVLTHAAGCELAPEERGEEVHAGQRSEYEGWA